jgi:myosin tail region-interacting protein MTI1
MALPFKVKALFEYNSPHEDDLNFPVNQIITVTEEEDDDWYIGEYTGASGDTVSGLFPKNFVERYEPVAPPRPTRAPRPKQAEAAPAPAPQPSAPEPLAPQSPPVKQFQHEEPPAPVEQPAPASAPVPAPVEVRPEPPPAPKPEPAVPATTKKPPPPVAEKPSSFRDRIAAFNKQSAPPIAPFKPGGAPPSTFVKKPFVAPPPSRNAYVPPPREQVQPKIYRREEDPEITEKQRQDQEDAEKAGLAPAAGQEEEAPKTVSLKERIALLQKQQMEQAARRAEHSHKEKPKRPPKKRTESYEAQEAAGRDSIDTEGAEQPHRESVESGRARRPSKGPKTPEELPKEREMFSDANDADQSAAGETTEDADGSSTSVEEDDHKAHDTTHLAPSHQPDVGDEEDETEEAEEEDELDEEARHQQALRDRMAKLSGGMGMPGMFGAMPMPGMGAVPRKKKPTLERRDIEETEDAPASPHQRVPMVPIPGMGRIMSPESTEPAASKEDEEEEHPITGGHEPEEVPDIEDIQATSPRERGVPPTPQGRHLCQVCCKALTRKPLDPFQRRRVHAYHRTHDGTSDGYHSEMFALNWILGAYELGTNCLLGSLANLCTERAVPPPRTSTDRAPPPIPGDRPPAPEGENMNFRLISCIC